MQSMLPFHRFGVLTLHRYIYPSFRFIDEEIENPKLQKRISRGRDKSAKML
jgi:hypothetical protein